VLELAPDGREKLVVQFHRQDLPLGPSDMPFEDRMRLIYVPILGSGASISCAFGDEEGIVGSTVGRMCWSLRRIAGKRRYGKALAKRRPTLMMPSRPGGGAQYNRRGG
jgi:hypothetical protein